MLSSRTALGLKTLSNQHLLDLVQRGVVIASVLELGRSGRGGWPSLSSPACLVRDVGGASLAALGRGVMDGGALPARCGHSRPPLKTTDLSPNGYHVLPRRI